jgi:hypothetical protein
MHVKRELVPIQRSELRIVGCETKGARTEVKLQFKDSIVIQLFLSQLS